MDHRGEPGAPITQHARKLGSALLGTDADHEVVTVHEVSILETFVPTEMDALLDYPTAAGFRSNEAGDRSFRAVAGGRHDPCMPAATEDDDLPVHAQPTSARESELSMVRVRFRVSSFRGAA